MALTPIAPEQWLAPAKNPDLGVVFDRAGLERPQAAILALLESAAGEHARDAQIQEQAFAARRDLRQLSINRTMCDRLGEVVTLVQTNNAGPSHD